MRIPGGKEQITMLAAAALLALVAVHMLTMSGDVAVDEGGAPPRSYAAPLLSKPEFVHADAGYYFPEKARDIFGIERGVGNIRLPDLPKPMPFPASLAFPRFLPSPLSGERPPVFYTGAKNESRPAPGDLISETDFSVLAKLEEPEEKGVRDRRNEKERDTDAVHVKGQKNPLEGEIKYEDKEIVIIVTSHGQEQIKRADIEKIEYDYTMEERHKLLTKEIRRGDGAGRVKLSQWCRDLGMIPESLEEMKKAVEEQGDSTAVVLAAAGLYHELGDYDTELMTYRNAAEAIPSARPDFLCRGGDLLLSLGLTESALDAYRKSFEISTTHTEGRVKYALALARRRDLAPALDALKKAGDASNNSRAGEIALGMALCSFAAGDVAATEKHLADARKGGVNTAEALNLSGVVKVMRKKHKDAVADFRAAIAADQYRTEAWHNLALCHMLAGKVEEGQILLAKAAERDPLSADVLNGLGLCSFLVNAGDAARSLWESAATLNPSNAYAPYAIGVLALNDAQLQEATDNFLDSLRLDYDFDPVFYNAGLCAYYNEELDDAEAIIRRRRSDPACRLLMGCVALARRELPAAEEHFKSLTDAMGGDPLLWNCRGYVEYHRDGVEPNLRLAKAKEYFQKAQQLAADDEYARSALAKIHRFETTRMFEDTFERDDAESVGNGWAETEPFGVEIAISNGRCLLAGVQKVKENGVTTLERETLSKQFESMELTLYPDKMKDAEGGMRFYFGKSSGTDMEGLEIGIDRKGNVVFGAARSREEQGRLSPMNPPPAAGGPLTIRIEKFPTDDDKEEFRVTINAIALKPFKRSQNLPDNYLLVIWAKAKVGVDVALALDDVRIYEKK